MTRYAWRQRWEHRETLVGKQRDRIAQLEAELRSERRVCAAYVELADCLKAHVRDQARHLGVLEELADLLRARWAEERAACAAWRKAYRRLEAFIGRLTVPASRRERKARHLVQ